MDTSTALHRLPRRADVAREQLRGVGLALRREGVVAAGVLAMATALIGSVQLRRPFGDAALDMSPEMGIPVAILAILLPMAVWKGEGPARRGYHQAMPVAAGAHGMARALAGLAWMLGAMGAYYGWLALVTAATGGEPEPAPWFAWAGPVVGAVALYLLGSALALRAAHPWRWIGGAMVGHTFLRALAGSDGALPAWRAVDSVLSGRYGLTTLLSGRAPLFVRRANPIYGSDAYEYVTRVPNAGVWMTAAWLWLAIAITLFAWAAYRQPEA